METYDFCGYATKADLLCSDGRIIGKNAFKECDGQKVPLVWNHQHNDPFNTLGHAILENRDDGVYAYCYFNDTESGQQAKELVCHGDITQLSIYANELKQDGPYVKHGKIREVSLVHAGANMGAFIESVLRHGDLSDEEGVIYTTEEISLYHSEEASTENQNEKGADNVVEEKKEPEKKAEEKTVEDVYNEYTEEQRLVCDAIADEAYNQGLKAGAESKNEKGEDDMAKHNVFDQDEATQTNYLSHSDMEQIFKDAKTHGSLREAVNRFVEDGVLAHSIDTTGMETATGEQTYGFNDASMLFPEPKTLNNPPEWISREMGWVQKVMNGVHRTPFSRIRSVYADITEDEARAKGYIKGNEKKEQVFTTLRRSTSPQTIYKKQKLDRDDVVDITDFDVVAWIRAEMRVMLDEEIARAILIGDGRPGDSDDKIDPTHVRPIATDVPLFNTTVFVEVSADADEDAIAKAVIKKANKARKNYKGSGNPTFWTTEDYLTDMLLLEDGLGYRLYKTESELTSALRVKEIVTVEPMEGATVEISEEDYPIIGVIVNLADYNVGADKGGQINMFDDFDIDYNQMKYLIETRISGALIKPFSAITLLLKQAEADEQPAG